MNEAKNLACPFCGGQARIISRGYQDGGKWTDWVSVTCPATEGGCGASQAATTESEAWRNWNRRAGGRKPAMSKTTEAKHVGISDLLGGMLDSMQAHGNLLPDERKAIEKTISSGEQYGFGNLMAWLATAWALRLRDGHGLPEKVAIEAVSGRTPYPLPPNAGADAPATKTL